MRGHGHRRAEPDATNGAEGACSAPHRAVEIKKRACGRRREPSAFDEADVAGARAAYLARHARARYWVDFDDFAFWRLDVSDVYFVGGFAAMDWIEAREYTRARPDPLADVAGGIVEHMNKDHADALVAYSKRSPDGENTILTVVNLDPHHVQAGWLELDAAALGIGEDEAFQVHDLLGGGRYLWRGRRNYVELDPRGFRSGSLNVFQPSGASLSGD